MSAHGDTEPFVPVLTITLDGNPVLTSRALGAATDALLRGNVGAIVMNLGADAIEPGLLGALARWNRRYDPLLRARVRALVVVIPSFWHALQWRLANLLQPAHVKHFVARSPAAAEAWVAAHLERTGSRPAAAA